MRKMFLGLLASALFCQSLPGQIVVVAHKAEDGFAALSPISADLDTANYRSNKAILNFSHNLKCSQADLLSLEWVTSFLQEKLYISKDFEVLFIIPINPNHVIVLGKKHALGYFEIFIPDEGA